MKQCQINSTKKAEVDPMKLIVLFIILAVVAAIVIYYFGSQFGKETKITEQQIGQLGDSDSDGIANFLDKCPDEKTPKGQPEYEGCSSQAELDAAEGKA